MSSNVVSFRHSSRHAMWPCRPHDQRHVADMSPTRHAMSANEGMRRHDILRHSLLCWRGNPRWIRMKTCCVRFHYKYTLLCLCTVNLGLHSTYETLPLRIYRISAWMSSFHQIHLIQVFLFEEHFTRTSLLHVFHVLSSFSTPWGIWTIRHLAMDFQS